MNRNTSFIVRMTKDEMQNLDKRVRKTGMSREGYVRTLCKNKVPVEVPPADYFALIREVRALGNNMRQLAHKANATGMLDAPEYRRHADEITALADKLTAVCVPKDVSG
jgi:hypothetical protein